MNGRFPLKIGALGCGRENHVFVFFTLRGRGALYRMSDGGVILSTNGEYWCGAEYRIVLV